MALRRSTSKDDPDMPKAKLNKESLGEAYKLFAYIKPYRTPAIIALLTALIGSGLALCFPYLMGKLVGGSMDANRIAEQVDGVAIALALVLLAQAVFAFIRVSLWTKAGESAVADIRRDTYSRLVRLPMTFFAERRVGELASRIAADLSLIRDTLMGTMPQLLRQLVILLGGLVMIFIVSVELSLVMLACIPVVIIATGIFGRRIRGFSKQAQDELADSNVVVDETLQGISNVKAFSNENHEASRYVGFLDKYIHTTMRTAYYRAAFISFIIFVLFGTITFVVWYGAKQLAAGSLTPEQFMQFTLFTVFVSSAIASLAEAFGMIQKAVGATQRVREILVEDPESDDATDEKPARLKGDLEMLDVVFAYPSRSDVQVLKELSFGASAGERIAIVGPSGAGKSTVISLLLRFYDPNGGAVMFDGKDAKSFPLSFLRSQMSIVPQEVLLFGGSIRENIAYGKVEATEEEIIEAAKKANAHEFIDGFPEGYDTVVGERGMKLSGGQRQRIAIARAILADPAILILDEATSSLDSESERLVQEALEVLMKDRTSIIIAHRLATVRNADRILVLNHGRAVESGTHEELSQNEGGVYQMLSKLQFEAA